ncbi:MAG TPA: DUF58 domain-containing protein [Phycisphaerae bacterium]|nr:DUF58 domain-containing protein [Phycisphaerae bacterium]HRR86824.1 DUF58 domain-containing protein [Phycisphaerae bacterium]
MSAPPTESRSRYLDLRALASLEHMRFTTRHRIEGVYSGRHQSRSHGGAGEFVDFREYVEGEDLRRLDWKVLARTGRAYLRLYQDETNLLCTLAIDASGSMLFGSRGRGGTQGSKLEYVQYLATALSHVISRQQDQVGLALLTNRLAEMIPPGSTRGHIAQIQERIERIVTEPVTRMADGLRELFERSPRRGVLMLMSDFLDQDLEAVFSSLRLFRHQYWEVILLHVIHPDEERLPQGLAYRFDGLEKEGHIDCSPADIRVMYEQRFAAHTAGIRTSALAGGCDYRRVSTAIPYLQTLAGFLVERAG